MYSQNPVDKEIAKIGKPLQNVTNSLKGEINANRELTNSQCTKESPTNFNWDRNITILETIPKPQRQFEIDPTIKIETLYEMWESEKQRQHLLEYSTRQQVDLMITENK